MSKYITVNVQHVNTSSPTFTNVFMQLDNMPLSEVLYYEGVAPIERYMAYTQAIYDIWQTDILTDTSNIDPVTSAPYQYRVVTIPESFLDAHMEMVLDLKRGGV